jgi:uncharacterized protein YcbX
MAQVETCYVYPVKGMTPAESAELILDPGKSPRGDRAFAFAYADAKLEGTRGWVQKFQVISGLSVPALSRIIARYDAANSILSFDGGTLGSVRGSMTNPIDREALATWLTAAVKETGLDPFHKHPEREPLQLLGDGTTLFTDRGPTQVSISTMESLASLSLAAGVEIDHRRFRSNLVIGGFPAWQEFAWTGKRLNIGETVLEVTAPLRRCKAVNASPEGAGRDLNVLDVLDEKFGHLDFGIEANVIQGGTVRPGDSVTLANAHDPRHTRYDRSVPQPTKRPRIGNV